jgi:hypothetical protein
VVLDGSTDIFEKLVDHVVKVFVWVDVFELEDTIWAVF